MDLFTYLLAKNDKASIVHKGDLFSYLLGRNAKGELKTATGTNIYITDAIKTKINKLLMTKESTQEGTPSPDYPQEVKTVKGSIDVKIVGKNLLPIGVGRTHNGITFTYNEDGTLNINGTATSNAYINLFVNPTTNLISDATKVYSFIKGIVNSNIYTNIFEYINGTATSAGSSSNNYGITYTPSSNSAGQIFRIQIPSGVTIDNVTIYPMIVEGDYTITGTNYEPYKESIFTISLGDNEIVGIGNYKDELIVDRKGHCWLNKKTGKVIYNGTEDGWSGNSPTTGVYRFLRTLDNSYNVGSSRNKNYILSNYFKGVTDNTVGGMYQYQTQIYFNMDSNSYSTVEDFKNWLSTHNTEVYYVLATENLIDLNYTVDIRLFKGVNNISNSDDMNMTLEYY